MTTNTTTTDPERPLRRHPAVRARRAALGAAAVGSAAIFAIYPLTAGDASSPATTPTPPPPTTAAATPPAASEMVTSAYREHEREGEHEDEHEDDDDDYRAAVIEPSTTAGPTAAVTPFAEPTVATPTPPVATTSGS